MSWPAWTWPTFMKTIQYISTSIFENHYPQDATCMNVNGWNVPVIIGLIFSYQCPSIKYFLDYALLSLLKESDLWNFFSSKLLAILNFLIFNKNVKQKFFLSPKPCEIQRSNRWRNIFFRMNETILFLGMLISLDLVMVLLYSRVCKLIHYNFDFWYKSKFFVQTFQCCMLEYNWEIWLKFNAFFELENFHNFHFVGQNDRVTRLCS